MDRFGSIATAIVSAAVFGVGLCGSAWAGDVFNACSKDSSSKLSHAFVNTTPVCKPGQTLRSWNEQGPPGSPGIVTCGPQEATATAAANTFAVMSLSCTSGHATGASAIWHTPFDAADNGPFYILPRSDNQWTVVAWNHTGTSQDFRFFLQCCG